MGYDEEILLAFKKAALKGRKEISSEALLFLTDIPEQTLHEKLKVLEGCRFLKSINPPRNPKKFWKLVVDK